MKRPIKFRGQHKVSKGWYYGHLYWQDGEWIITTDGYTRYVVDEKTIGQATGFKEIHEGDILRDEEGRVAVVKWEQEDVGFIAWTKDNWNLLSLGNQSNVEIIGNIYENPALTNKK